MREIEIDGGVRKVRGITRAEIEILAEKGYPISRWGIDLDGLGIDEKTGEMVDEVNALGCLEAGSLNFEGLTPADDRRLFLGIVTETFGARDEEKNLSRSGNGGQTENE